MTTAKPFGETSAGAMLRRALPPTVVVGVVCVVAFAIGAGTTGLWGALLGAGFVAGFFGLSLYVLGTTRRLDPVVTLMVVLVLYAAKIVALGIVLAVIGAAGLIGDPFDRTALGVTIIACTVVWTTFEIVAATKHRQPLYDLGSAAP